MSEYTYTKKPGLQEKEIGRRAMERLGQEIRNLLTSFPDTNPDLILAPRLGWAAPTGALAAGLKKLDKPIPNEKVIACELEVDSKTVVLPENQLMFGAIQDGPEVVAFAVITPAASAQPEASGDALEYFDHISVPLEVGSWQPSQIENFVFTALKSLMNLLERPAQGTEQP
jgi:hypothetical protein